MRLYLRVLAGTTPENTEAWNALNPLRFADRHPERSALLIAGAEDDLIEVLHSERFAEALTAGGHSVDLELVPHSDHLVLTDPRVVGEVILNYLEQNR